MPNQKTNPMHEMLAEAVRRVKTKPVRICRTLHHCFLCQSRIVCGQEYADGGYSRRAHTACLARFSE